MLDSSVFSLLLSTCFLCAEQVEGVILSHFYCLGFIIRDLLHAWKLGVVVVAHKILETAIVQNPLTLSSLDFGPGTWNRACQKWKVTFDISIV